MVVHLNYASMDVYYLAKITPQIYKQGKHEQLDSLSRFPGDCAAAGIRQGQAV